MQGIEAHRAGVDGALTALGLGWDAWPEVVTDPRLPPDARLSAVLVLLAADEDDPLGPDDPLVVITVIGEEDDSLDWLGRARKPWQELTRMRLVWDAGTAAEAIRAVTRRRRYDERRVAIALRGARLVCSHGQATAELVDALEACARRLAVVGDEQTDVVALRHQTRRILASVTPWGVLDLSLLTPGDAWAEPAREVARSFPADEIADLVRLLGDLGPRKPSKTWCRAVDAALRPAGAGQLLRNWLELAAEADIVPEWPGSAIGECRGTLFIGVNADIVRAAVWVTTRVPDEAWPPPLLGVLARRGAAHNGAAGLPEALALKVASAAVDALVIRGREGDRRVLAELRDDLQRRDLARKVSAALD